MHVAFKEPGVLWDQMPNTAKTKTADCTFLSGAVTYWASQGEGSPWNEAKQSRREGKKKVDPERQF